MNLVIGLLGASLAVVASNAAGPPVKVSLTSSWAAPPVVAEIIETVALVHPEGFFPLLDQLTDPRKSIFGQSKVPEALYQSAISTAAATGILQGEGAIADVRMNLALHAATPKLEAFYQHYEDRHNNSEASACGSWVDWYGIIVCDVEQLAQLAGHETIDPSEGANLESTYPRPKLLTFDHIYPPPSQTIDRPHRTAILYATLDSENFRELHSYLYGAARKPIPLLEYVLRYVPPQTPAMARNYLSGYGVALDLKKTDYLAVDDRLSSNRKSDKQDESVIGDDAEVDHVVSLIQAHPENESLAASTTSLTEDELLQIGSQAVQLIAESSKPLDALIQLSQNFPKYATSLAKRVRVNSSIENELAQNAMRIQGGFNLFWLNGAHIDAKDMNALVLLELVKKERLLMNSMTSLGLSPLEAFQVLTHPAIVSAQKESGVTDGLFDASDRAEEGDVIVWWNDLEKDSRYSRWSSSLYVLLRQMYPGAFPNIKLNIFNVVLVLDLSQTSNVNFIAGTVANLIDRHIPFRFGVVPMIEDEDSLKMARLFYHLIQHYGRKKTLAFLGEISQVNTLPEQQSSKVDWGIVHSAYNTVIFETERNPEDNIEEFDAILQGIGSSSLPTEKISAYIERLGATRAASPRGHAFFNGRYLEFNDDFLRALQNEATQYMTYLQEKVYEGTLADDKNIDMANYFYDLPTTSKRRNHYIVPPNPAAVRIFNLPALFQRTGLSLKSTSYLYPDSENIDASLFIIADFDTENGRDILKEVLSSLTIKNSRTRVTFLHNPTDPSIANDRRKTITSWTLSHLITSGLLSTITPDALQKALFFRENSQMQNIALPSDSTQIPLAQSQDLLLALADKTSLAEFDSEAYNAHVKACRLVARDLQVRNDQVALLFNGRLVGPIKRGQFLAADFLALENYEHRKRSVPVTEALKSVKPDVLSLDRVSYVSTASMLTSIIASSQQPDPSEVGLLDAPQRPRQRNYQSLESNYTGFELGDKETALFHIGVLLDPLSATSQKWSSLLQWLSTIPDVFIEVHLNPGRYNDLPLKRFYRYNLLPSLSFDQAGNEIPAQVTFENIPVEPIYTLAMDVPSSWLVRPREALYDLDNILLTQLSEDDTSVDAVFALDYLVVEGHAREVGTQAPPRGVQLELVTSDGTPIADTQVVANLGYLQFKAKPGVFRLQIREGPGRKIFQMASVGNEGWDSPSVEEVGNEITVTSFDGLTLYPRLARLPGMESADVLAEETDNRPTILENITSKFLSIFSNNAPKPEEAVATKPQADINIFTVASGLLYERFASIMILSVLRNTKSSVKFWFIENFLSPSFLEFIPHMAAKYGFEYELVTYKWPSWLRAQTEKQRIIWAYKILFLDVLFPMDLKRVIFVDADQIVRADLKELADLDLQGAPYGYTPMGDDNKDMEGFRFWKTGYWKDFLKGLPYHISALYVIDLVRFRKMAAGDLLRGQYQYLSADPHSLANLDQDLPNNLQREVPIFSLHEDWLWCETWCSKDRLHRAKTIDLCQNPLTKEPKLSRARQIPEWEEYDGEIAQFSRALAKEGKIHSRLAAAGADVLANAGSKDSSLRDDSRTQEVSSADGDNPTRDEL